MSAPPPIGLEALRRRLDAGLSRRPRVALDQSDLVSAAVLVPITDRGGPHLLFTKKTGSVPHHKGQFSFPGGIVDVRDGSRVETALREAWEEIHLPAEAVEVLGMLDDTPTRATNFIITPVVGIVRDPVELRPDGREIERVLEVPLQTLRDPAIFRTEIWERNGEPHPVLFYDVSSADVIWGATARILSQFLALLDEPESLP
ncbi:MAG TPA: CoA pyrophosphatase [Methylomirabilota bacterium]